jgi:hypothetical protein
MARTDVPRSNSECPSILVLALLIVASFFTTAGLAVSALRSQPKLSIHHRHVAGKLVQL